MTNEEREDAIKFFTEVSEKEVNNAKYSRLAIEALEQNAKLKETIKEIDKWVHSGNRGDCDYFIVDQVEEIINGLKKDGTVSE